VAIAVNDKLRASTLNAINTKKKMWTVAALSASANVANGTPAVVSSAPSATYKTGEAYQIVFHGLLTGSATGTVTYQITDAVLGGTNRMGSENHDCTSITGAGRIIEWNHYLANTTGADITRVLALSLVVTSTGVQTMKINAGATQPWYWACYDVGLAADYPEAVLL
jgi:hypothetical protein